MEEEIVVLYNLLNKTGEALRETIKRRESIRVELVKKKEELAELQNYKDKLETRMDVLQQIIDDTYDINLKSESGEISAAMITEAIVKGGDSITSSLHPGKLMTSEIHLNKSITANEAARQIAEELEKNIGGKKSELRT